jgi:hypothetical protein
VSWLGARLDVDDVVAAAGAGSGNTQAYAEDVPSIKIIIEYWV